MSRSLFRGPTPKPIRELLRQVQEQGHAVTYTKGGHIRVDTPQGPYIISSTPSSRHAVNVTRTGLRRRGVQV